MPRHPDALYLLALLLVIVPVLAGGFKRSIETLTGFFGAWREKPLRETYLVKYFFASLGILFICTGMILALAGFQRDKELEISDYRGADIVFAMDISRSMLCEDLEPNRLERAVAIARGIVERSSGTRFGIVVFKGDAVRTIPVTEDTGAVNTFLDILDPILLSSPGSNAEEALRCAMDAFPAMERRRKIVVLFSDGESLAGDPVKAAMELERSDIAVVTVGVGTEEGGVIPLGDGSILLDASGREVVTRMEREVLQEISRLTAGEYIPVVDPGIVNKVSSFAVRGQERPVFVNRDAEVYRGYLLAALAGFFIFLLVKVKRWKSVH